MLDQEDELSLKEFAKFEQKLKEQKNIEQVPSDAKDLPDSASNHHGP